MEDPRDSIPLPPILIAPRFLKGTSWFKELAKRVPIGREVDTYHRGRIRKGMITSLAPKATISHRKLYIWVEFSDPDLVGTMYQNKLSPLNQL